ILIHGIDFWEQTNWTERRTIPYQYINKHDYFNLLMAENVCNQLINRNKDLNKIKLLTSQLNRTLHYLHLPIMYSDNFLNGLENFSSNSKRPYNYKELIHNQGYF
ncbi:MAG: hypothetical protein ACK4XI_02140, partial [Bacteroidota bacterium]